MDLNKVGKFLFMCSRLHQDVFLLDAINQILRSLHIRHWTVYQQSLCLSCGAAI
jgi:hypothetical protein